MKIHLLSLIIVLSGCATQQYIEPKNIVDETNSFVEHTYDKARSAGLELLHEKPIKSGTKEIRIWLGFGIVVPEEVVILTIYESSKVSGMKLLLYNKSPQIWKNDEDELKEFLEDLSYSCPVYHSYEYLESCSIENNQFYDWAKIYKKLVELNIWSLPDDSKLPMPEMSINDGFAIVVELRENSNYRAYSYGNPGFRKQREAQNASEIMSIIMSL